MKKGILYVELVATINITDDSEAGKRVIPVDRIGITEVSLRKSDTWQLAVDILSGKVEQKIKDIKEKETP